MNSDKKFIVAAVVALIIAVVVGTSYYVRQRGEQTAQKEKDAAQKELTKEEILEKLSAPKGAVPKYTGEERRKILEKLSAPEGEDVISDAGKEEILEKLSAPQQ